MFKTAFPCIRITRKSFKYIGYLKQISENRTYLTVIQKPLSIINNKRISYENQVNSRYLSNADKDLFFDMIDGENNISLIKDLLYSKSTDPIILNLNKCENQEEVSVTLYIIVY